LLDIANRRFAVGQYLAKQRRETLACMRERIAVIGSVLEIRETDLKRSCGPSLARLSPNSPDTSAQSATLNGLLKPKPRWKAAAQLGSLVEQGACAPFGGSPWQNQDR
jgi:hypothetical protein